MVIKADSAAPILDTWIEPDLASIQGHLGGGYLEGVSTGDGGWHAYCDEEGKLKRLPVNHDATQLAVHLGWGTYDVLCGPVVFLGDGKSGEEGDVPRHVVELALTLFHGRVRMVSPEQD